MTSRGCLRCPPECTYYSILYYATLYYGTIYYTYHSILHILQYIILWYITHILQYIILWYITLYYSILYYGILQYILQYITHITVYLFGDVVVFFRLGAVRVIFTLRMP